MIKKSFKVREITPLAHRCGVGVCPSVFDTDEGSFLIIGKTLEDKNIPDIVKRKIGEDETVIRVPKGLIMDLLK
ncbi:hypothetical protein [Prevotella koreensis]